MKRKKKLLAWIMTFVLALTMIPGIDVLAVELVGGGYKGSITDGEIKGKKYSTDYLKEKVASGGDTQEADWPILYPNDVITDFKVSTTTNENGRVWGKMKFYDSYQSSSSWSKGKCLIKEARDYADGIKVDFVMPDSKEKDFAYWRMASWDSQSGGTDVFYFIGIRGANVTASVDQITANSAQLSCRFTAGTYNVEKEKVYLVKEEDAASFKIDLAEPKITGDKVAEINKEAIECNWALDDLDENTKYVAILSFEDNMGGRKKKEIPFETLDIPQITVPDVTPTTSSACLKATIDLKGSKEAVLSDYGFEYQLGSADKWTKVDKETITKEAIDNNKLMITCDLAGLKEETSYNVRGYLQSGDRLQHSKGIGFVTKPKPAAPTIRIPAVSATTTSACLKVTIDLGTAQEDDLSDYGFEYKLSIADKWTKVSQKEVIKEKAEGNTFTITYDLAGLEENTSYNVRGYLQTGDTTQYSKSVVFTTKKPGGSSSSSVGGSSGSSTTTKTPSSNEKTTTAGGVNIPYTVIGNGKGEIIFTKELIEKVTDSKGNISIDLNGLDIKSWTFAVPGEWFSQEGKEKGLIVKGFSTVAINDEMLRNLNIKKGDDVSFEIKKGSIMISMKINGKSVEKVDKAHPIYTVYNTDKRVDENFVMVCKDNEDVVLPLSIPGSTDKQMLFLTPGFGTFEVKDNHKIFKDIAGSPAEQAIKFVSARELLTGVKDDTFAPNASMTRGMFVTILGRLYDADTTETASFSDVTVSSYYAPYVAWASANHIVDGIGNNKFAPEKAVTHEEMAKILCNYMRYAEQTLPKTESAAVYSDADSIADWAKESVEVLQNNGVFEGTMTTGFKPKQEATRAEISMILESYITKLVEEAGSQIK